MSCPARVREAFALFDNDGDGELSGRDVLLAIRSCGVIPTPEEIKTVPAAMSWPDFEAWMTKKLSTCKPEEDLIKAFKVVDRSNDGTISADELSQVMIALGELLSDEDVKNMIKEADPNGTGRIQYANFVKSLLA